MKRIAIVIPYIGKFPNYFPLWLRSVRANPTIDWLVFTDNHDTYDWPSNVKVMHTSFGELREYIQRRYSFPIVLDKPWDLCAFKVAYGEIFEEYLQDYDFWGFGDVDLIYGDLRKFLTDDILDKYEKIGFKGHLQLIRNTKRNNSLYKEPCRFCPSPWQCAFEGKHGCFDEEEINDIFEWHKAHCWAHLPFANFAARCYLFKITYPTKQMRNTLRRIVSWQKGRLFCHELDNGIIYDTEFAYVHFIRRHMDVSPALLDGGESFIAVPNRFAQFEEITPQYIMNNTKNRIYWAYIMPKLTPGKILIRLRYEFKRRRDLKEMHPQHYWRLNAMGIGKGII